MKIEKLTPEQEARFPEFVKKWTEIGLSTEPANRKEAEKGVNLAYKCAGLEPPEKIIWCESPMSMALTRGVILEFGASVQDSVWDSVGASVGDSVRASVRDSVGDSVWDSVFGQHESPWLSFYSFFDEVLGLREQVSKLDGLLMVSKNAGWFIPHEKVCWISERHNTLHRDEQGRLHNLTGPALTYPDGWSIYSYHGTRVHSWMIENPEKITPEKIKEEKDIEVRSVMREIYNI